MYIVNLVSNFFNSQMRSILQLENKSKKARNIDKIITNKKKVKRAKEIEIKTRKTRIERRITKKSIKANAKTSAKATATTITITTKKNLY